MKTSNFFAFLAVVLICAIWSTSASAVPAFARQSGQACVACHFQHYPALNDYGRAFKAGAYTQMGHPEAPITGERLSIPFDLNASLVTKIIYDKTNGTDQTVNTNTGNLKFPDEAALLIGGHAAEFAGFLLEMTVADNPAVNNFGAFKVHFNRAPDSGNGANYGMALFTADSAGPGYGFELLNTGATKIHRVDEFNISAQKFVGFSTSAAEGLALVASGSAGFANLSFWTPDHDNTAGGLAVSGLAKYLRVAVTPRMGSWDTGFGFQYFTGTARRTVGGAPADKEPKGWDVDAQMQGTAGSLPLGVYLVHAKAPYSAKSPFNATGPNAASATSLIGELGVVPGRATVMLGYRRGDTGAATNNKDNTALIGGTWQLAQNMQIQLDIAKHSGSKYNPTPSDGTRETILMLHSAF